MTQHRNLSLGIILRTGLPFWIKVKNQGNSQRQSKVTKNLQFFYLKSNCVQIGAQGGGFGGQNPSHGRKKGEFFFENGTIKSEKLHKLLEYF